MLYSVPHTSDVASVDTVPGTNGHQPMGSSHASEKRTDAGNATRFLNRHGHDVHYCHPWQKWLVWRHGAWNVDDTAEVVRRAEDTVKSIYAEAATTDDEETRKALAKWATASETEARIRGMLFLRKPGAASRCCPMTWTATSGCSIARMARSTREQAGATNSEEQT